MKKRTLVIISLLIFVQAGWVSIGLSLGMRASDYLTPNLVNFYFRTGVTLWLFVILYAVALIILLASKNKKVQIIAFALSIIFMLPVGHYAALGDYECYEYWGMIPIKNKRIKNKHNSELYRINSRNDGRTFTKEQAERYHCLNQYDNDEWITFQYGLADSCVQVYNGYPEFFKLKKFERTKHL